MNLRVSMTCLALSALIGGSAICSAEDAGTYRISDGKKTTGIQQASFFDEICDNCNDSFGRGNRWSARRSCLAGNECRANFVRPPGSRIPMRSVSYDRYWPGHWHGQPASGAGMAAPMVYQPTDTSHLGFYHVHAPRWRYRADMLPPAPRPHWPLGTHCRGSGFGYCPTYVEYQGGAVQESAPAPNPPAQENTEHLEPEPET